MNSDFEVQEYITSFRTSSDRVRHVLYVIIVICVVVFALTWNIREKGWAMGRVDDFIRLSQLRAEHDYMSERLANLGREPSEKELAQLAALRAELPAYEQRAEYVRQLIGRTQLLSVPPLIGLSFDYNELGPISGVVLVLLMLLLAYSSARQHENLYLCAFKVRRLHDKEDRRDGESAANFLYHALAMTQVLNHPPTLARFEKGAIRQILGISRALAFFLPAIVLTYVAETDYYSLKGAKLPLDRVWFVSFCIIVVLAEAILVVIYAHASEYKWRQLFFDVNPNLLSERDSKWSRWLDCWRTPDPMEEAIANEIESARIVTCDGQPRIAKWMQTLPLPSDAIESGDYYVLRRKAKAQMARYLFRAARRHAGRTDVVYGRPKITTNVVENGKWTAGVELPYQRLDRIEAQWRREERERKRAATGPGGIPAAG